MKNYILFAGDYYYPSGGMRDWIGDFDIVEEAQAQVELNSPDWAQIVSHATMEIVCEWIKPYEVGSDNLPGNEKYIAAQLDANKNRGWQYRP